MPQSMDEEAIATSTPGIKKRKTNDHFSIKRVVAVRDLKLQSFITYFKP